MKLSEYKQRAARKVLVYGAPKTGKTEAVGALSSYGYKLHWFDLEDGVKTLLRPGSAANPDNIELFRLPDTVQNPIAVDTVLKVAVGTAKYICEEHGRANCIQCKTGPAIDTSKFTNKDILVIDSVSQLSLSVMNHILRDGIAKNPENVKPGWDEYFKQGFLLERIFSNLQQANYNVVAISHENMVELDDKKKRLVPVAGTSNFSKVFSKYWDDVVYAELVNGKYKMYSDAAQNSMAIIGSRAGKQIGPNGLIDLFKD